MTVIPYRQGGLEMGEFDAGAAIESGVDGAEAQNLGFGAALGQVRIAFMPELIGGFSAADFALTSRPVEGMAQLTGYGGKLVRGEATAVGQGWLRPTLAQRQRLTNPLCASVRVRWWASSLGVILATMLRCGRWRRGDGFHCEREGRRHPRQSEAEARAGRSCCRGDEGRRRTLRPAGRRRSVEWLLIAQGMEDAVRGGTGGDHTARDPTGVGFVEEVGDLTPAGCFAGLAGFADQDDEEIEAVTGGAGHGVRFRADHVAEGGEELQEDGCGIGFSVQRETSDSEAGHALEGGFGEGRQRGRRARETGRGPGRPRVLRCRAACTSCLLGFPRGGLSEGTEALRKWFAGAIFRHSYRF